MDHVDRLLAYRLCGLLPVKFRVDRDHEHIVRTGFPSCHKSLVHRPVILSQLIRNVLCIYKLITFICVNLIVHLRAVEHTHSIGLNLF